MSYVDLNTIHNPTSGTIPPASWGDQIRDNLEFLVDPPAVSAYHSAAVTLTDDTLTKMVADSELFDNASWHSTSSNTSRLTAPIACRALVFATVVFDPNATGERLVDFLVNNTTQYVGVAGAPNPSGSRNTGITVVRAIIFAAGDYVECRSRQKSGGNLDARLYEFGATFLTRV